MVEATRHKRSTGNATKSGGFLCLVFLATVLSGCGGYMSRSAEFRRSMTAGMPNDALSKANKALGVERAEQLPSKPDGDTPLLLLERATILQALGRYELSARDFQLADKSLDVLDLTGDTSGKIAKYLFSDSATVYKAPAYEKLLLNTVNMINYLVRDEVSGAKVEARRFLINRKFVRRTEDQKQKSMLALGSYLAGLSFEMAGDANQAIRHYADAVDAGGIPTLTSTITNLYRRTGASDIRLKSMLAAAEPSEDDANTKKANVIIIVQAGMAPYKVPERMPIGAAIVAGSSRGHRSQLTPAQRNRATRFAAKGVLKWINYPQMRKANNAAVHIEVDLDQATMPGGIALDVERAAARHYKEVKGSFIAAAVVRMLTRAVAGGITEAVSKKATNSGLAGLLIGLVVEGAMTAADTPDTRSWVTLPGRFYIARAQIKPGEHQISVRYRGQARRRTIKVTSGQTKVLNFSAYR
jgi:tetratricopeptide (TPR) repeat protein